MFRRSFDLWKTLLGVFKPTNNNLTLQYKKWLFDIKQCLAIIKQMYNYQIMIGVNFCIRGMLHGFAFRIYV